MLRLRFPADRTLRRATATRPASKDTRRNGSTERDERRDREGREPHIGARLTCGAMATKRTMHKASHTLCGAYSAACGRVATRCGCAGLHAPDCARLSDPERPCCPPLGRGFGLGGEAPCISSSCAYQLVAQAAAIAGANRPPHKGALGSHCSQ
jgi:hypothetical protein